ncbi:MULTISPECIES: transposase family protein [unclassified Microcoleus]|uniref:transposase family protein n=1 Tax=unclassified Microcoleus TaxID=2642155 RepID=UPI0025FC5C37|nr:MULTISPECIES: transposase family protein [unclassified Microcoleus]
MSQIAIVEAFADLPDTRRRAGQRHHQALCLALFTLGVAAGNRGFLAIGDWLKAPERAISNFISTACGALTLIQYDSADITAVRVSDLFWLFIEVFWDSTFERRNDCTG